MVLDILKVNFNVVSFKSFEDTARKISVFSKSGEFFYDDLCENRDFSQLSPIKKLTLKNNILFQMYSGTIVSINSHFKIKEDAKEYFSLINAGAEADARNNLRSIIANNKDFNLILQFFLHDKSNSKNEFVEFLKNNDGKTKKAYRYKTASNVIRKMLATLNLITNKHDGRGKRRIKIRTQNEQKTIPEYDIASQMNNLKEQLFSIGLDREDITNMISVLPIDKQKELIKRLL